VSIGLGLPMFIRGMSETVKAKIRHFGDDLDPGDILLTNDAYITGSHLNHMTFTVPIFHDGELVGFSCCMAHWPDVGGTLVEGTTDIFSEGLQMPIVKIHRKGVPNEELIAIIRTNVRIPERAMGDFRAQLAAVKTGEKRFVDMIRKYGRDDVLGGIAAIMDQSEALARARVRDIPDGVYEAESFMDDDGINVGQRVPIKVRVTVAGDKMTCDLSEVSKQVQGFYNSGITAGYSCCQVAFKCLTSALDLPINDGQFRALDIVLPPGRVVSAVKPAAMRMWMTYPMTIVDTIFKALAPALPDKVAAGHHADLVVGRINGRRPKDDSFYIYLGGLIGGGWGAKHDSDGRNAVIAMNDGDTHNGPSEQVEAKYPLLVERYCLRPDSGGAGKFRGGLGTEQVVQARHPIRFSSQMDRVRCKPWGLNGGLSALGNSVALHRFNKPEETHFPNGKALNQVLQAGDAYILRSGGGGGYGSPLERDLALLERDVRRGYVTSEAAEKYYGAVFMAGSPAIDVAATEARRAAMRIQGLPHDEPVTEIIIPFPAAAQPQALGPEHEKLTEEERVAFAMRCRCCS
jgi:N-methylhydantoinase B